MVWAANLLTFGSSSREFELCFSFFPCLFLWFVHAKMSNDVLVMIFIARDHDYFFFSHISEEILCCFISPLSPPLWLFWVFPAFWNSLQEWCKPVQKYLKKFKKSGTNWGGQSNAWLCQPFSHIFTKIKPIRCSDDDNMWVAMTASTWGMMICRMKKATNASVDGLIHWISGNYSFTSGCSLIE